MVEPTLIIHSEVWRDLIAQASDSRVELSDPEIETAEVIDTLLHILIKGALPKELFWVHVVRVVKLGRKYAFDGLLKIIDYEARCCLYEKTGYSACIMIVAANLDNMGLFVRALNDVGKSRYALPDEAKFGDECTGARTIDPSTLALEDFRLVKSEVMWAWMRAYRVAFGSRDIDRQEEERLAQKAGKEFQRLMKLEGQYLAVLPDLNTIVDTVRCSEDAVVKVKGLHTDRRVSHCMEDTPGADQAGGI